MIDIQINESVARNQNEALAALFVSDKETRKRIRKTIKQELKEAVKRTRQDARQAMNEDPRKAYMAVKYMLYRQILGGNISILQRKRAGARYKLIRERKVDNLPPQRGGNRRSRSPRTEAIDTYYGADRNFILRFLNSGTVDRQTKYGSRGSIAPRNWFTTDATNEMNIAAENLSAVIEEELAKAYKEIDKT